MHDAEPRVAPQAHLESCAACRAWLERRGRIEGALQTLSRIPAPSELAVAVHGRLERERTLAELERRSPPTVLERLVDEEIQGGRAALVARLLRGLPRADAPAELDLLVARGLGHRVAQGPTGRSTFPGRHRSESGVAPDGEATGLRRLLRARWSAPLVTAAAATLLLVALQRDPPGETTDRPTPRRTLVLASSPAALNGLSAALAYGLGGGLVLPPDAGGPQ